MGMSILKKKIRGVLEANTWLVLLATWRRISKNCRSSGCTVG
jgi:hypothetical protein